MSAEWLRWQNDIVKVLQREYCDLFPTRCSEEINWDAWRPLFERGYSPRVAVEQAASGSIDTN